MTDGTRLFTCTEMATGEQQQQKQLNREAQRLGDHVHQNKATLMAGKRWRSRDQDGKSGDGEKALERTSWLKVGSAERQPQRRTGGIHIHLSTGYEDYPTNTIQASASAGVSTLKGHTPPLEFRIVTMGSADGRIAD